ncbi:hypothetical protein DIRU0_D12046 [Diutina rugosa]
MSSGSSFSFISTGCIPSVASYEKISFVFFDQWQCAQLGSSNHTPPSGSVHVMKVRGNFFVRLHVERVVSPPRSIVYSGICSRWRRHILSKRLPDASGQEVASKGGRGFVCSTSGTALMSPPRECSRWLIRHSADPFVCVWAVVYPRVRVSRQVRQACPKHPGLSRGRCRGACALLTV